MWFFGYVYSITLRLCSCPPDSWLDVHCPIVFPEYIRINMCHALKKECKVSIIITYHLLKPAKIVSQIRNITYRALFRICKYMWKRVFLCLVLVIWWLIYTKKNQNIHLTLAESSKKITFHEKQNILFSRSAISIFTQTVPLATPQFSNHFIQL